MPCRLHTSLIEMSLRHPSKTISSFSLLDQLRFFMIMPPVFPLKIINLGLNGSSIFPLLFCRERWKILSRFFFDNRYLLKPATFFLFTNLLLMSYDSNCLWRIQMLIFCGILWPFHASQSERIVHSSRFACWRNALVFHVNDTFNRKQLWSHLNSG